MKPIIEIEPNTAINWLSIGSIRLTETGEENSYYINEFGMVFYSKNYPPTALEQ